MVSLHKFNNIFTKKCRCFQRWSVHRSRGMRGCTYIVSIKHTYPFPGRRTVSSFCHLAARDCFTSGVLTLAGIRKVVPTSIIAIGDMSGDLKFTMGEKLRLRLLEFLGCLYASKDMSSAASRSDMFICGEGTHAETDVDAVKVSKGSIW